ncbi:GerAB/ArcD/ProY family transporter [Gorillibacterium timonense]|uniref:GerAB/ArcD/ProY family transporter n=1 Tax=Gorillibacterium timonense TaxID=1689269 RepID=UPI00071CC83C|nr:endospore germination permease [Gorillibacterium timonense]
MSSVGYADPLVSPRVVTFTVSKMIIGIGILTLPDALTSSTHTTDGWISILLGGLVAILFSVLLAQLTTRFPQANYHDMISRITHPFVAHVAVGLFALYMFLFTTYEIRGLSSISKLYLFDETPVEAICLVFLLVLVYGASGSSLTLLRLNTLFLPVVLIVLFILLMFGMKAFHIQELKPMFITPAWSIAAASKTTVFSYLGAEILLFYNVHIGKPEHTKRAVVIGMIIPIAVYLSLFLVAIGVFSEVVVENTLYPIAELAKQVEVPGGLIERFESFFFLSWVLSLFCTAVMALDVTILAIQSLRPRTERIRLLLILAPLLFLVSLQPRNLLESRTYGEWISYMGIVVGWILPAFFLLLAVLRGIKGDAKSQ